MHPEEKHVHSMFDRFSKLNAKPPKLGPCNWRSDKTEIQFKAESVFQRSPQNSSTWSVVNMPEGHQIARFLKAVKFYKALSLWHAVSSSMFLMVAMGLLFMLAFMMPSGAGNRETADEPEVETEVVQLELTAEPPTPQFAMHDRSLGAKYPTLLADVNIEYIDRTRWWTTEWECKLLQRCYTNALLEWPQTMRDSLTAMNDLSDDEESLCCRVPEDQFLLQVQKAYQAYEIGLSRVRRAMQNQGDNSDESLSKSCMNAMCIQTWAMCRSQTFGWRFTIQRKQLMSATDTFFSERDEVSDVE